MEFHQIVLMSIQIMNVLSKKHDISSSDESIENLLYYKGCQHSKEEPTTSPPITRLSHPVKPKAMDCPYPKMCCSLTCGGNECGSSSPFMTRQNEVDPTQTWQNYPPIGPPNEPPKIKSQLNRGRKKKDKQQMRIQMQPPIGGRRNFGFTKERIKSLINQDEDIRKILKDLVKVTMKKVDLVDMINMRKQAVSTAPPFILQNSDVGDNNENDGDNDYESD